MCCAALAMLLATEASAQPQATSEPILDNKLVHIDRVTIPPGAIWTPARVRGKRLIVAITGNLTKRHAKQANSDVNLPEDKGETIERKPGDVIYRTESHHSIQNLGTKTTISDIIEFKTPH